MPALPPTESSDPDDDGAYDYDAEANTLWAEDLLSSPSNYSETYSYDGVQRLRETQRGQIDAGRQINVPIVSASVRSKQE